MIDGFALTEEEKRANFEEFCKERKEKKHEDDEIIEDGDEVDPLTMKKVPKQEKEVTGKYFKNLEKVSMAYDDMNAFIFNT